MTLELAVRHECLVALGAHMGALQMLRLVMQPVGSEQITGSMSHHLPVAYRAGWPKEMKFDCSFS